MISTSAGRNPGEGAASLELRAPDDPRLVGLSLATQYRVVDAGAVSGFAHTDGLAFTLN